MWLVLFGECKVSIIIINRIIIILDFKHQLQLYSSLASTIHIHNRVIDVDLIVNNKTKQKCQKILLLLRALCVCTLIRSIIFYLYMYLHIVCAVYVISFFVLVLFFLLCLFGIDLWLRAVWDESHYAL